MNELNLDAESITKNKVYDAFDHLKHLLKIGWLPDSPLIKKFLIENRLTSNDLESAMSKLKELENKECCIEREG